MTAALTRPVLTCRRCRQRKPREEFWPNPKISTGRSSWCKACSRAASRASRERYRERYNAQRRKPPLAPRTCPVCAREFEPRSPNQVYCEGRGQCYRRATNAAYRDRPLILGKVGEPFDCARCSKRCTPGENVAPHASKFCGRTCKARWHKQRECERAAAQVGGP